MKTVDLPRGSTLSYPEFAYAFNPCCIIIKDLAGISVRIGDTVINRAQYNGRIVYDLSAIAQSLFDTSTMWQPTSTADTKLRKTLTFTLFAPDGNLGTWSFPVIWGALQIGQINKQIKKLTYFAGREFYVPVTLSQPSTKLMYSINQEEYKLLGTYTTGKYNIPLPNDAKASHVQTIRIKREEDAINTSTFDYTFDYTFLNPMPEPTIDILIETSTCDDGIYLKWINTVGDYCYYLFQQKNETNNVANGPINLEPYLETIEITDGHSPGTNYPTTKEAQKTITLFAPLVDIPTLSMLETITQSALVYMQTENADGTTAWVRVNIAPGTFTKDGAPLQDFNCQLILPKTFTQSL